MNWVIITNSNLVKQSWVLKSFYRKNIIKYHINIFHVHQNHPKCVRIVQFEHNNLLHKPHVPLCHLKVLRRLLDNETFYFSEKNWVALDHAKHCARDYFIAMLCWFRWLLIGLNKAQKSQSIWFSGSGPQCSVHFIIHQMRTVFPVAKKKKKTHLHLLTC